MLKNARLKKRWTAEFVSSKVGVSLETYRRWESGAQHPRHTSIHTLCQIFEMSPEELGFTVTEEKENRRSRKRHIADSVLHQEQEQRPLAEALALWTMGIDSCWHLYMIGGQTELERLLPTYLAGLTQPTLKPGPEQLTAARLMAQVYQLIALAELQHGDFVAAQSAGTQALVYSQLSRDWNIYIASQLRLASIFMARKRVGSALSAYNDALRRVNAGPDTISPILQSWVFAGLGEIQAMMGREQDALQFLRLAVALFPSDPLSDPCYSYARCDRSLLFLYEGLVFLHLGQPKLAWDAFAQVDDLRPLPPERIRAEFLKQKTYTSCVLGNMVQSCIYLEAAARAAQSINSELALSEVYALYEHLLALWGSEPRVRALAQLFQQ
ncbi:MAG: helix-turn-helix transcriptional regulator [Ktedonobacteraceae bacterium]|nr:helix-turn-helix transcriptional regulator [Ktedonobacteraceae bacterium]